MKSSKSGLLVFFLSVAGAVTLPIDAAAHGQPAEPPMVSPDMEMQQQEMPPKGAMKAMPGMLAIPPYLRNAGLSDVQEDRIYALLYDQAPRQRELIKFAFKSMTELRRLAFSERYDSATARALAESHARAIGNMALQRAELDAGIRAVLTMEQRKQIDERLARMEASGGRHLDPL